METVIMENAVSVIATLLITLIGVAGAWVSTKIAKREELGTIQTAIGEVTQASRITVMELQQTFVEGWKKAHADGKLTEEEIKSLGTMLLQETMRKLSKPTVKLLTAASVDINAIITGVGEALIADMKKSE